jgi:hypothetical protein
MMGGRIGRLMIQWFVGFKGLLALIAIKRIGIDGQQS